MTYFFQEYRSSNGFTNNPTLLINGKPTKPYDPKKGHSGVDLIMPEGTPLTFPIDLVCVQARYQEQMGNVIYLQAPDGNIIVCGHNSELRASKGDTVPRDSVAALSGNSGSITTNPHSHIEVIAQTPQKGHEHMTRSLGEFHGFNIDPIPYLESLITIEYNATDADLAHRRFKSEGIITQDKDLSSTPTWGELLIVLNRLHPRNGKTR